MDDSIYNDVGYFKEYKSIFDSITEGEMLSAEDICRDISSVPKKYSNYVVEKICPAVINYLKKLLVNTDESYKVNGCKYLYYALYEMAQTEHISNEITYKLYKELLERYNLNKVYICEVNIEEYNSDIIETHENLLNLYNYFYKYEKGKQCNKQNCDCAEECVKIYNQYIEKCNNHYSSSLCTEINKFAEKFNNHLIQDIDCKDKITKLETFKRYNLKITILIPIILIFVISFSFIILYKFTPFGSKLHSLRGTKTKMYNNFDQKLDHMQSTPKYVKGKPINRSYNISYYSEDYS
ncbi:PIR protein [Plasmodium vivax]|uniref:VIR protein n=1 Tax=Plasmodium vivax TaxID=5855 RepID=A0A564ZPX7_PLAVI|nr:PIR protein [Plasmodium vivax]